MKLEDERSLAQKVNDFLQSNRKIILGVLAGIFVIGIISFLTFHFKEKSRVETIAKVEKIIFDLEEFKNKKKTEESAEKNGEDKTDSEKTDTEKSDTAEADAEKNGEEKTEAGDSEFTKKEDDAIAELSEIAKKTSGYASFRANTAIAEIYFARKNYAEALKFYENASVSSKSSYTSGVACFNAATCADELGNNETALEFYQKAVAVEDFPLVPRAMFNAGRIFEALAKPEEAISAYNKLLEKFPKNEWALLAKSRIIVIEKN